MADPLSIGASVVGIVGAALHGSKRLYEFIDSLRNAPKDITALSADLRALYQVLGRLAGMQDKLSGNPELCDCLTTPLENCLDIFEEFTTLLNSFAQTTRDGTVKVRTWKNIAWAFKDKEIQLFRDTITTYKVSLDVAVNAMTFSAITSIDERTRRIETDFKEDFRDIQARLKALDIDRVELASISERKGSEWYGTDAHFALNRFFDYTESLCDSPPRSFPGSPTFLPHENSNDLDSMRGIQHSLLESRHDPIRPTALPGPSSFGLDFISIAEYSLGGLDLLELLWKVTIRKNPKHKLGAVDLSCAFVVCDVTIDDTPIIYASKSFETLTGYSQGEILTKNCRFLQAPDGKVDAGLHRPFVDNGVVFQMKKAVDAKEEAQFSLINYRKGGKPFVNLLTIIPISWDGEEIRYYVGFQLDIVANPDAISQRHGQGIEVDYKVTGILSPPLWTREESSTSAPVQNGGSLKLQQRIASPRELEGVGDVLKKEEADNSYLEHYN